MAAFPAEVDVCLRAGADEGQRILASEALFIQTLDPSVLVVPTDGLITVSICGLSGAQFEECEFRCDPKTAMHPRRAEAALDVEVIRSGLMAVDGVPESTATRKPAGFDVEAMATDFGRTWPDARREVAARIRTLSDLGPSAGSSSAPSSGEPTQSTGG
jgi:hypothetical protein